MKNLNYYSSQEVYAETYYQLPKIFFTNSKYKRLSSDAKIAYAMLKDRFNYSLRNNWCDENNHIYFVYTVKELQDMLNCGTEKVTKIKKELENVDLLYQQRVGLKKANRLYLLKPIAESQDVYLQTKENIDSSSVTNIQENKSQSFGNKGFSKIEIQKNKSQSLDNKGFSKIKIQKNKSQSLDNKGFSKIENNQYKDLINIDTNRHLIDTEQDNQQDRILLDSFVEIMKDESIATFIPERVLGLIKAFSSSYAEAQQTVRTIHNAKNKAQKETGQVIAFEELENYGINADAGLYNTLLKAYQKQKTEQVENIQNLIFVYVKNWFIEKPIAHKIQVEQENELPKVSVQNWVRK